MKQEILIKLTKISAKTMTTYIYFVYFENNFSFIFIYKFSAVFVVFKCCLFFKISFNIFKRQYSNFKQDFHFWPYKYNKKTRCFPYILFFILAPNFFYLFFCYYFLFGFFEKANDISTNSFSYFIFFQKLANKKFNLYILKNI